MADTFISLPGGGSAGTPAYGLRLAAGSATPYGQPIPRVYGRAWLPGIPFWSSKPQTVTQSSTVNGTGLNPPQQQSSGITASFACLFGEPAPGSDAVVLRLRIGGVIVYDVTGESIEIQKPGLNFTIYPGSQTQGVDPTIASQEGANAPAFRGRIYIVFTDYPLSAGVFPTVEADIATTAQKIVRVHPFRTDPASVPFYWTQAIDYKRNIMLALDNGFVIDTYDLRWNRQNLHFDLAQQVDFRSACALTYNYTKPYILTQKSDLSNSNTIYVLDYSSGSVVASFGTEDGGTASDAAGFTHPGNMVAFKPFTGVDALWMITTTFKEVGFAQLVGSVLSLSAVPTTSGVYTGLGVESFAAACAVTNGASTKINVGIAPPKVDTSGFTFGYYADGNKLNRIVHGAGLVPSWTALYAPKSVETFFGSGVYTYYSSFWQELKLPRGTRTMVTDIAAGITGTGTASIVYIATGPEENPWVSVIFLYNGKTYLRRYDTAWTYPATIAQLAADLNASDFINTFSLAVTAEIPAGLWSDTCRNIRQMRKAGTNVLGYKYNGAGGSKTMIVLNLFSGSYETINIGATGYTTVDETTGASYSNFQFDDTDFFEPSTNCVLYAWENFGIRNGATKPGLVRLRNTQPDTLNLGDYLTQLCLSAGYQSSQITTVGLGSIFVRGGIINQSTKLIDVLSQICALFRVDVVQRAGTITFTKHTRGTGMVLDATALEADLVEIGNSSVEGIKVERVRDMAFDLPAFLQVDYIDGDNANAIGTQTAKRTIFPVVTTKNSTSLNLSVPVIMHAGEALYWAMQALFDMWGGATVMSLRLPPKFMALEAADLIRITFDNGMAYLLKVEQCIINADLSISVKARTFAQFLDLAAVPPTDVAPAQTLVVPHPCNYLVFDNLMLSDADNSATLVPYRWTTAEQTTLYEYVNTAFAAIGANAGSLVGTTRNALPSVGGLVFQPDYTNTLTVLFNVDPSTLSFPSTDALGLVNGVNAALVGNVGRWELIFWQNATQNSDGSWTFSNFIRGRRGSDAMQANHAAGDYFVLLRIGSTTLFTDPATNTGAKVLYMPVTLGMDVADENNIPTLVTLSGGPLKPFSPCQVHIVHTGTDYIMTWVRRDRLSNELHDLDGIVPMSEATELYELEIYSGTTLKRTVTGLTAPTYTYSEANATVDGFTNPLATLSVRIYQISAAVGRGYPGGGSINVE